MLFGGYKASKLKPQLKMAVTRFQISANKKSALMKQQIREIAKLLAEDPPKEEKARIKAEALIRDDNTVEAYELLQLNCELLSERIHLITHSRDCPPDLVECISTLIWSSMVVDIPELVEVRKQFRYKYGKQFDTDAMMNVGGVINDRVAAKLSVQPPSAFLVQTYLEKIADEHEVKWKPTIPLQPGDIADPMPAPKGDSVLEGGGSGLNPRPVVDPGGGPPSAPPISPSFGDMDIPVAPRGPASPAVSSTQQSPYVPVLPTPAPRKSTTPTTIDEIEEVEIHVPATPKSPPGGGYNKTHGDDDDNDDDDGYYGGEQKNNDGAQSAGNGSTGPAPSAGMDESFDDLAARFAMLNQK